MANKKKNKSKIFTTERVVIAIASLVVLYIGYIFLINPHIEKRAVNAAVSDIKLPKNYTLINANYYPNQWCLDTCTNEVLKYATSDESSTAEKVIKGELASLGYKKAIEADYSHDYIDKKYDTKKIKAWYGVEGGQASTLLSSPTTGSTLTIVLTIDNSNE
jgi:hypothetical protein